MSSPGGPLLRPEMLRFALDRPAGCLTGVAVLTLLLGSGLLRLELRTDGASLHPGGNAVIARTREDRLAFLEREQVIVLVTSRPGAPAVESREGLVRLRDLHWELASLPGVDRIRPRSLVTLLDPNPALPLVSIVEFLRDIPEDPDELAAMRDRLHEFSLAEGLYLSADGRAAAIYVPLATGSDRREVVAQLSGWVADEAGDDFELRLLGPAVAEVELGDTVLLDLAWLVPLMIAAIAALLFLCLRTTGGVLIPLAAVLLVLVWTLGAMGHCGVPVTLVTTILPVVLMSMAVTDEIHLLERFQAHRGAEGHTGERDDTRRAIGASLHDVGRPIVLTSLTTATGFLSFLTAAMPPIQHFGVFTAVGILLAMLLTFTFVPALLMTLPPRYFERRGAPARGRPSALLFHERFVLRRPGAAALLGGLFVLAAVPGLLRLSVQDAWVDNFDPGSDLVSAEHDFNARFWGSYRFDVVISSEQSDFFRQREGYRLVEELRRVTLAGE
jgi:predicted RND superfamily exporter protein